MKEDYTKEILRFINEQYPDRETEGIAKDDLLFEKGILDSFGVVELIAFLESKFKINFKSNDLVRDNFMTPETVAGLVERKMAKGNQRAE